MAWLDDLKTLSVAGGVSAGSILLSSYAKIPAGDGPFLSIIETGGTAPDRTQGVAGNAYENPGAQFLARGASYTAARAMLVLAYNAVTGVQNQTVNGVWYVSIRPLQSQFIDLLSDEVGRARVAFNVLGNKRP